MEIIKISNEILGIDEETSKKIVELETTIKELKQKEEEIKTTLLEEMEKRNIIKIETDDVIINYIAPTDRETLDTKQLKEKYSEIYDECIKITPVKASVRIKVK